MLADEGKLKWDDKVRDHLDYFRLSDELADREVTLRDLLCHRNRDPGNDMLTICRLGTEHYKGLDVGYVGDEFDVQAGPNAKAGTYTFTYYTCDYSYLVPGTITVTVVELPDIKVTAPASRPGTIRIKNPFDFKIRFLYGSFREGSPDGKLLIGPKDTVVVKVERTKIDWIAFNRKGTLYLGQGHVKGIELSRGAAPLRRRRAPGSAGRGVAHGA